MATIHDVINTIRVFHRIKLTSGYDKSYAIITYDSATIDPRPIRCISCNDDTCDPISCITHRHTHSFIKVTSYSICRQCFEHVQKTLTVTLRPNGVRFNAHRVNEIFVHKLFAVTDRLPTRAQLQSTNGRNQHCNICTCSMRTYYWFNVDSCNIAICEECVSVCNDMTVFETKWRHDVTCALWILRYASYCQQLTLPFDIIRIICDYWVRATNFHGVAAQQLSLTAQTPA